jgi:hypothetical protein
MPTATKNGFLEVAHFEDLQEFPKHSPNPRFFGKIKKIISNNSTSPPNLLALGKNRARERKDTEDWRTAR